MRFCNGYFVLSRQRRRKFVWKHLAHFAIVAVDKKFGRSQDRGDIGVHIPTNMLTIVTSNQKESTYALSIDLVLHLPTSRDMW